MVEETNGEMDNEGKKGMERCVSVCVYGGGGGGGAARLQFFSYELEY